MDPSPSLPPPPTQERCYRHPDVATGVHCTRCGRPICPDCMIPAPVGHQCPSCVADARKEYQQGAGKQITRARVRTTPVTKFLLIAIAVGYVWELVIAGGPGSLLDGPSTTALIDAGALVPATGGTPFALTGGMVGGEYWRLLTSMFLHAGLLHIAFNAYALWIFGTEVERDIGSWSMLAVYLVTGVFAGAASYAFAPGFVVGVGASGAIFGVLGAFIVYNYRRRQHMLAQARVRGALMLLLINFVIGLSLPQIDWRAHLGGLIAGLVAGYAVDPERPPALRHTFTVAGMIALLLASIALVAFRNGQIQADPTILFGAG